MLNVHLLPASYGDSIFIEYGTARSKKYILIDGGPYYAYDEILSAINRIAPDLERLELLVVTHIDTDHIEGIAKLLNQKKLPFEIQEIWFNGYAELKPDNDELGALQGEFLSELIEKKEIPHNLAFDGKAAIYSEDQEVIKLKGGLEITMLSPTREALTKLIKKWEKTLRAKNFTHADSEKIYDILHDNHRYDDESSSDLLGDDIQTYARKKVKEDKSAANKSSIAFLAEYKGKRCLFAGDTPSGDLQIAIEQQNLLNEDDQLKIDAWKLAHHGSKKSTQADLINIIDCSKILIGSDGKRYKHPNPEVIAKLVSKKQKGLKIHFNYRTEFTEYWDNRRWKEDYKYEVEFPEDGEDWYRLEL